jgi:hypothetical protein
MYKNVGRICLVVSLERGYGMETVRAGGLGGAGA